jgi:peptide/nickel transport system substrate-binding protein
MGIAFRAGVVALAAALPMCAQAGGELRFGIHADPKTYDPLLATEEVSETIGYLTGGVLVRFNRQTQRLQPELASSWKVLENGRRIDFALRHNVSFSDGAPFGPADVIATVRRLMSADLQSAIADTFRSAGGDITAKANGADGVSVFFSAPVAGLEQLFDQLAIAPARRVASESAVLGPFVVAEHKSGQYVLLKRNPRYWKTGADGKRLPYLDSLRLDIQANREIEMFRYRSGELQLVDKVEPEAFERLSKDAGSGARNAGPSLDTEFFWFNQNPEGPLPAHKKRWFQSRLFRLAASAAVNREDMVRLVYRGYGHPALGPVSPSNKLWFNAKLKSPRYDPQLALKLLQQDGFRLEGGTLRDRDGNAVEFSLITNAGNKTRAQIGTMLQQDFMKIGIRVNFLPMEFQSLIERITRTQQYEACLLGTTNVEIDPNSQMNVLVSSGTLHAWYPGQAKPATAWEAAIDRLMQAQHTAARNTSRDAQVRKSAFDRVQEIVSEEAPIVYLVHPDVLVAVSPSVRNAAPSLLTPHLVWNIEYLSYLPAGGAATPRRRN